MKKSPIAKYDKGYKCGSGKVNRKNPVGHMKAGSDRNRYPQT
jgi:hypothetical protein